jgi:bifunctional non-homologous end joining protein LigD
MIENHAVRFMSRSGLDLTENYPGLSDLGSLPPGLVLDGELVAFQNGKPSFDLMLSRGKKPKAGSVRFIAFDILYENYDPLVDLPLSERRQILERVLRASPVPQLVLSEGLPANGVALYQKACEQGLEGVMAKRLSSTYTPGRRSTSWVKIKRRIQIHAAVIGYIEKPGNDFQCLLVASNGLPGEEGGPLRYVGRVGGGFTDAMRARVNALVREHPRKTPLVLCPEKARWVEPGLYCAVSFAELTTAGLLRAPVFEGLIEA